LQKSECKSPVALKKAQNSGSRLAQDRLKCQYRLREVSVV